MKCKIIYVEECELSRTNAPLLKEATEKWFKAPVELHAGVWHEYIDELQFRLQPGIFGGQKGSRGKLNVKAEIATWCSHASVWQEAVKTNEYILVLEDDAYWESEPPYRAFELFKGDVMNVGLPNWGTPKGRVIRENVMQPGLIKRPICDYPHDITDMLSSECYCDTICLFGAHAYFISPTAAQKLLDEAKENGIMPADTFIRNSIVDIYDLYPLSASQWSTYIGTTFSNIINQKPRNNKFEQQRKMVEINANPK